MKKGRSKFKAHWGLLLLLLGHVAIYSVYFGSGSRDARALASGGQEEVGACYSNGENALAFTTDWITCDCPWGPATPGGPTSCYCCVDPQKPECSPGGKDYCGPGGLNCKDGPANGGGSATCGSKSIACATKPPSATPKPTATPNPTTWPSTGPIPNCPNPPGYFGCCADRRGTSTTTDDILYCTTGHCNCPGGQTVQADCDSATNGYQPGAIVGCGSKNGIFGAICGNNFAPCPPIPTPSPTPVGTATPSGTPMPTEPPSTETPSSTPWSTTSVMPHSWSFPQRILDMLRTS